MLHLCSAIPAFLHSPSLMTWIYVLCDYGVAAIHHRFGLTAKWANGMLRTKLFISISWLLCYSAQQSSTKQCWWTWASAAKHIAQQICLEIWKRIKFKSICLSLFFVLHVCMFQFFPALQHLRNILWQRECHFFSRWKKEWISSRMCCCLQASTENARKIVVAHDNQFLIIYG